MSKINFINPKNFKIPEAVKDAKDISAMIKPNIDEMLGKTVKNAQLEGPPKDIFHYKLKKNP